MQEEYVVEIVSTKSGIVLQRSTPRSKEAADCLAEGLKLSDMFRVQVVPYVAPKREARETEGLENIQSNKYRSRVE